MTTPSNNDAGSAPLHGLVGLQLNCFGYIIKVTNRYIDKMPGGCAIFYYNTKEQFNSEQSKRKAKYGHLKEFKDIEFKIIEVIKEAQNCDNVLSASVLPNAQPSPGRSDSGA